MKAIEVGDTVRVFTRNGWREGSVRNIEESFGRPSRFEVIYNWEGPAYSVWATPDNVQR